MQRVYEKGAPNAGKQTLPWPASYGIKGRFPVNGTQRKVLDFNVIDTCTCSYHIVWCFQVHICD